MTELRDLLEALADDGRPRGADEVLRRARRQLATETSPARGGRPHRWFAAAAAIVAVVVAASTLILVHDDGGSDAPIAGGNTARPGALGTWRVVAPARSGLEPGTRVQAIERVPGGLVAVGSVDTAAGLPTQAAWTSTDGRSWARAWSATFGPGVLDLVTATGDGVVAVGSTLGARGSRSVWRSDDGSRWQRVTSRAPGGIRSVVAGGPGLVAAGFSRGPSHSSVARAAIWTSVRGRRWTAVPGRDGLFPQGRIAGLAVDGGGVVAVGTDRSGDGPASERATVWSSADGTSWRRVPGRAGLGDATVTPTTPIVGRDGELRMLALPSRAGAREADECTAPPPRRAVWGSDGGRRWGRLSRVGAAPGASLLAGADGWWLAGGARGACDRARSVVYLSPDGRRWTEARTDARRNPAAGTVQAMSPTADGAVVVVGRPGPATGGAIAPEVWLWTAPAAPR